MTYGFRLSRTGSGQSLPADSAGQARREDLIFAARLMLSKFGLDGFTMVDVAKEAKVSSGTAYRYFSTREELLLVMLTSDLNAVFDALEVRLLDMGQQVTPEIVGSALFRYLSLRPSTLPLLQVLHTRLERNVPTSALEVFRVFMRQGVSAVARAIEDRLGLEAGAGARLVLQAQALAIGLYQIVDQNGSEQDGADIGKDPLQLRDGFEAEFVSAVASLAAAARLASRTEAA